MIHRWPIRAQLLALTLATTLPFAALIAFDFVQGVANYSQLGAQSSRALASATAGTLTQVIEEDRAMLAGLAARPAQRLERPAACDPLIAELHSHNPRRANIVSSALSGDVVCSAVPVMTGVPTSVLKQAHIQRLLRTGEFSIGEPFKGLITGRWVVPLAFPLRDPGDRLIGWIGSPLDLERVGELLSRIRVDARDVIVVVSAQGKVVSHSSEALRWAGTDVSARPFVLAPHEGSLAAFRAPGLGGVALVWGAAEVRLAGWKVLAGVDEDALLAPTRTALLRNGILLLLVVLLATGLSLAIGREIAVPVRNLAQVARRIRSGEADARASSAGPVEIAQIATELNRMLDARERDESELRLANQRFALAASSGDVWDWDLVAGRFTIAMEFYRRLGYADTAAADPRAWFESVMHPEDLARLLQTVKDHLARRMPYDVEFRLRAHSGEYRWIHARGQAVWNDQGRATYMAGTTFDVTERRRAEDLLRESEARFKSLTELSSDWYWEQDEQFRFVDFSPSVVERAGSSIGSHIGKTRWELPTIGVSAAQWAAHRAALEAHQPFRDFEFRRATEQGETIWMSTSGAPVFDPQGRFKGYRGVARNITERKRTEDALRESAERLAFVVDGTGTGLWDWDLTTNLVRYSRMWKQLLGYEEHEVADHLDEWRRLTHPDDVESTLAKVTAFLQQRATAFEAEFRMRHKSGEYRWILSRATVRFGAGGEPTHLLGLHTDITARKQAETRVKQLTSLYAAAYETGSALLRLRSPRDVYQTACNVVVTHGGLTMAWVGLAAEPGGRVLVASHFGPGGDELRNIVVSTDASLPEGRGPTGTAIRENRQCVANDLLGNPERQAVKEFVLRHGFRSLAATPIVSGGRAIGALAVCSVERDFFDEEVASLLRLVAGDIGFVLDLIETESVARRHAEQLERLSRRVLSMLEQERAAIARELHDEIGQVLTAVKLQTQGLAREFRGPVGDRIARGIPSLDQAIAQTRGLALDLRPPQLDHLGLAATLRDTLIRVADPTGLEARLVTDREDIALDRPLATAAFRVAQEAITNVVRHAAAKTIIVELRALDGELQLAVSDDGRGYDLAAARARAVQGESMGLIGMEERAALAGGTLTIITRPGQGTRVEARFPLY